MYEVVQGLLGRSDWDAMRRIPLVQVPCGSGNALAASTGTGQGWDYLAGPAWQAGGVGGWDQSGAAIGAGGGCLWPGGAILAGMMLSAHTQYLPASLRGRAAPTSVHANPRLPAPHPNQPRPTPHACRPLGPAHNRLCCGQGCHAATRHRVCAAGGWCLAALPLAPGAALRRLAVAGSQLVAHNQAGMHGGMG